QAPSALSGLSLHDALPIYDVEGRIGKGQRLTVRLHAAEVAVEGAAAEADVPVDEDVGRDELAAALEPEAGRPRLGGSDLEDAERSEEHTSELQSRSDLVCR